MAEQSNNNTSDEIDLGQLFQLIGRGFNKLGIAFLRLFLYLKKRAFILGGLILLGLGIGYGLNQITEESKKIEVIVKPNLDSENYLYDVVAEIESNIKTKDITFFKSIGVSTDNLEQFEILLEPIEVSKNRKGDLELFEKFKDNPQLSELIRRELEKNSAINHRIEFIFKNKEEGQFFAERVMDYINSADFFKKLVSISNENAKVRIQQNQQLIQQIDIIIENFAESLSDDKSQSLDNRIRLDNEKPIDMRGLLELKNSLIQNTEQKRIELQTQVEPISILNFGKPQKVTKAFLGRKLFLMPIILIGLFFLYEIVIKLNEKSNTLT